MRVRVRVRVRVGICKYQVMGEQRSCDEETERVPRPLTLHNIHIYIYMHMAIYIDIYI